MEGERQIEKRSRKRQRGKNVKRQRRERETDIQSNIQYTNRIRKFSLQIQID